MSSIQTPRYSQFDFDEITSFLLHRLHTQDVLSELEADEIVLAARAEDSSVDQILIRTGKISQLDWLIEVSNATGLDAPRDLKLQDIDYATSQELGEEFIRRSQVLPLSSTRNDQSIATSRPLDIELIRILEFSLSRPVNPVLATSENLQDLIEEAFPEPVAFDATSSFDKDELRQLANQGPVVSHLNSVFERAIEKRASDIHFESTKSGLKTRLRVNGLLEKPTQNAKISSEAIISRLKFLADLNLSERRKPLDGRISYRHAGRDIDMRLSILPTQYGQSAVIRVLDQDATTLDWFELGFDQSTVTSIRSIISKPNGLFLVTGPTGSGKTTTLYTALAELNKPDTKILTIEDPIEYNLDGINQTQVNEAVGLTFATALRSILRQDPNIILLGEIRDQETAEMACRAALVGRLVLSTLHVNSPNLAKARLRDLGVADYLIDAVLNGVLGQELGAGEKVTNAEDIGESASRLSFELIEY